MSSDDSKPWLLVINKSFITARTILWILAGTPSYGRNYSSCTLIWTLPALFSQTYLRLFHQFFHLSIVLAPRSSSHPSLFTPHFSSLLQVQTLPHSSSLILRCTPSCLLVHTLPPFCSLFLIPTKSSSLNTHPNSSVFLLASPIFPHAHLLSLFSFLKLGSASARGGSAASLQLLGCIMHAELHLNWTFWKWRLWRLAYSLTPLRLPPESCRNSGFNQRKN